MLIRLSLAVLLLMASPTVLLGQVLVPDRPSGQGFFVPGPAPQTPQVFTPLRAVPEHNPPPVGPSYHPYYQPRMSGVFGFVDLAADWGGTHDREYYLLGRGDGLFLMEATPPILGNPVPTWQDLAATANDLRGDFIPHNRPAPPGYVSPPYPTPPFTAAFPHPGANVGGPTTAYTGWSECAVLRDPSGTFWAYGSSGHPTLMANPSLFVVRLQRTSPNASLRFDVPSAAWVAVQAPGASQPLPNVHNMTVDQDSGLLFACENDHYGDMYVMTVNPPGSYANPVCLYAFYSSLQSGPHDVLVKDRKVYVSHWIGMSSPVMGGANLGFVDEYAIADFVYGQPAPAYRKRYWAGWADTINNPHGLHNPHGLDTVHSVYPSGSTLWMVGEQWTYQKQWLQPGPCGPNVPDASKGLASIQPSDLNKDMATGGYPAPNTTQYQPQLSTGRPTVTNDVPRFAWENMQAGLGGLITLPTQGGSPDPLGNYLQYLAHPMNPQLTMHSIVHHIRGIYQTGFFAHYCDGIDLVDLSDPALGPQIMGSFDTADENMMTRWWTVPPPRRNCNAPDVSRGAYDLWPHHDSGLICVANGAEGAMLFRVDQGHFNRYWRATPFGPGATSPGVIPRIVAENGPPRFGRPFIIRNGNRASLATPGSTIYRYTLVANYSPPTSAPTSPGPNGYFVNVSPLPPNGAVYGPQVGSDMFVIPGSDVPLEGTKVFMQMIVEEGLAPLPDSDADFIPLNPPRFSASRGTWIGVCKQ